ncbi:MAG: ABC-2 transporter permease [Faecalibacterium sp.]
MKGLLWKDWYQMLAYSKNILGISVLIMLIGGVSLKEGNNFFLLYGGMLLGMLPMTLLSYDQTTGWNEYAGSLPVTREQLVGSKYLIGLIVCGISVALAAVDTLAMGVLPGIVSRAEMLSVLVQVALASLMGTMVMLPLVYRFGAEKARMVYMIFIGAFTAAGMVLVRSGVLEKFRMPTVQTNLLLVAMAVVAAVLYALSWRLSVTWYAGENRCSGSAGSTKSTDTAASSMLLHWK